MKLFRVAKVCSHSMVWLLCGMSGLSGGRLLAAPAQKPAPPVMTAGDLGPVSEMEWATWPPKMQLLQMVMVDRKTGTKMSPVAFLKLSAKQQQQVAQVGKQLSQDVSQVCKQLQSDYTQGRLTMAQKNDGLRNVAVAQRIAVSTSLKNILSAKQFDQIQELEMLYIIDQRRGPLFMKRLDALDRPELQAVLHLTLDQRKRMSAALKSARAIMRAPVEDPTEFDPLAPGALDRIEREQAKNFDRALDPILHILTSDQCKRLSSLFRYNYSFVAKK